MTEAVNQENQMDSNVLENKEEVAPAVEARPDDGSLGNAEDSDPMLSALRRAEAEIEAFDKEGDKAHAPQEVRNDSAKEDSGEAKAAAQGSPMIPKQRFDEVLGERNQMKDAVTYLQGIVDTQRQMLSSMGAKADKPAASEAATGTGAAAAKTEATKQGGESIDPASVIAKAEGEKLNLAQKYEDGEISLVDFEKQRIELDRTIRATQDAHIQQLMQNARQAASETVAAHRQQESIEELAVQLQEAHPYVAEIDALPEAISKGVWAEIDRAAKKVLQDKGYDLSRNTPELMAAFIREKAALTDTFGPKYTGKQLSRADGNNQAGKKGISETAQQRADKLNLAQQQPPSLGSTGASANRQALTEDDIMKMTDDQLADLVAEAPLLVQRAVGMK